MERTLWKARWFLDPLLLDRDRFFGVGAEEEDKVLREFVVCLC